MDEVSSPTSTSSPLLEYLLSKNKNEDENNGNKSENFSQYLNELTLLLDSLAKLKESETKLSDRCKDHQATIQAIQRESENAWKEVDYCKEKELRNEEALENVQSELDQCRDDISRLEHQLATQEVLTNELEDEKVQMKKDQEATQSVLNNVKRALALSLTEKKSLEVNIESLEKEIKSLESNITRKSSEVERENRRRVRTEEEVRVLQNDVDSKAIEICTFRENLHSMEAREKSSREKYYELKASANKLTAENQSHIIRIERLLEHSKAKEEEMKAIEGQLIDARDESKASRDQIISLTSENTHLQRKLDYERNNVTRYQGVINDLKVTVSLSHDENTVLQKELNEHRKREEQTKREVESLERERNIHIDQLQKSADQIQKAGDAVTNKENIARSLEKEINSEKKILTKVQADLMNQQRDGKKLWEELSSSERRNDDLINELHVKELEHRNLQKTTMKLEAAIKEQKQRCDEIRSEKSMCEKNLMKAEENTVEVENKRKILLQEVSLLKDELNKKNSTLSTTEAFQKHVESQRDHQKREVSRVKQLLHQSDETIAKQYTEIRELGATIKTLDKEANFKRREYEQIISERDVLGAQLIRKSEETSLLYEKLKIQQSILSKGELQYRLRLDDLRILKLKLKDVMRQLNLKRNGSDNNEVSILGQELILKHKELLQEKAKVKALSEELENPLNIHRWRKLEGSDPEKYELVQKVHSLQKKLIQKNQEVMEKGLLSAQKEKENELMKKSIKRQERSEIVSKELMNVRSSLKRKDLCVKAMTSEILMYQKQSEEYKFETDQMSKELQDLKRKYYEQKRKEFRLISRLEREEEKYEVLRVQFENTRKESQRICSFGIG